MKVACYFEVERSARGWTIATDDNAALTARTATTTRTCGYASFSFVTRMRVWSPQLRRARSTIR